MTDHATTTRFTPERHDEALRLRAAGKTLQEIAEDLGVSIARVTEMLGRGSLTLEERQALARFPGFDLRLARRLADRFTSDAAVRVASDADLLSVRGVGPATLQRIRGLHPRHD